MCNLSLSRLKSFSLNTYTHSFSIFLNYHVKMASSLLFVIKALHNMFCELKRLLKE